LETTLIVAEKPDAALHIADALSVSGPAKRIHIEGVPIFEVNQNIGRILVCSALGHLYVVAEEKPRGHAAYPVYDFVWKPKYLVERGQKRQERWIHAIVKASKECGRFISACDLDLEGSLIGYMILKYACDGADRRAGRMKFSTLTPADLRDAYERASPELDFPLAFAGMCRHEVDWLFGINLSRALTQSAHKLSGHYTTLSTGRVQGPTLRFLVEREYEIETFVPTPYWTLKASVEIDGKMLPVEYENPCIGTKSEAEIVVRACAGKTGRIEKLESNLYDLAPPTPFDLPSLQNEAYRHFGLSPSISLGIAERLYLDQAISYPRTSSQKLPPSIGYENIVRSLGQIGYGPESRELLSAGKLVPHEGSRADAAHPAIYPTGRKPERMLQGKERELFDLVVRRFLATFGRVARRRSEKATINIEDYRFLLYGSTLTEKGWTALYRPYAKFEDITIPPLRVGQAVQVHGMRLEEKYTHPPPRYNPSSILRKMEEAGIGTKATRAEIIETLYKRGYVTGQSMVTTQLGFRITEILTSFCPRVVDVTFTRELEAQMEEIERGNQRREKVVKETIEYLKPIIETLKSREKEIGTELTDIISEMQEASTTLFVPCPKCGSRLRIVRNPRTKKRFIGCSGKWKRNCTYSLPLPQLGRLKLLPKRCTNCGFQLIQVSAKSRRPLISCSRCYAEKRRLSAKDEKMSVPVRSK